MVPTGPALPPPWPCDAASPRSGRSGHGSGRQGDWTGGASRTRTDAPGCAGEVLPGKTGVGPASRGEEATVPGGSSIQWAGPLDLGTCTCHLTWDLGCQPWSGVHHGSPSSPEAAAEPRCSEGPPQKSPLTYACHWFCFGAAPWHPTTSILKKLLLVCGPKGGPHTQPWSPHPGLRCVGM